MDVLDGDTIRVAYPDGSTGLVNLAGIDSPDLYGGNDPDEFTGVPDTSGGHQYLYGWGWISQSTLRWLLATDSVEIHVVESTPTIDDYPMTAEFDGVEVAYVYTDGTEVNRDLLRRGVARATDTDHPNRTAFIDLMTTAQEDSRGVWNTNSSTGLSVP